MSFVKRLWKDRVSQYPNRRAIYDGSFSKSVTVSRDEGTVTEAGDPFNAENMNDLEDRIEAGLAEKPDREEVEDMVEGFFPLDEASGAVISINPGVMLPLRSCECQIKAYQEGAGDPSPINERKIFGFNNASILISNKNLFAKENYYNLATSYDFIAGANYRVKFIRLKPNTKYTISHNAGVADNSAIILLHTLPNVNATGYYDLRLASSTKTFTTGAEGYLYIGAYNTVTDSMVNSRLNLCNLQIEEGNAATSFDDNYENVIFDWGINQWDEEWEVGGFYYSTGQKNDSVNDRIRSKNYIPCLPSTTYYFNATSGYTLYCYDASYNFVSRLLEPRSAPFSASFTTPANAKYLMIGFEASYGTTYKQDTSINFPATYMTYFPYVPNNPGVVYGGRFNATAGELIVTHHAYTYTGASNESWGKTDNYYYTLVNTLYQASFTVIANRYKGVAPRAYSNLNNFECALSPVLNYLNIRDDTGYQSIDDYKAWLANNPLTVVYKLVTPFVYNLDPVVIKTLLNQNNIYHDCNGDIDVIFHKAITAKNISFDNSGTTLTATNVEDAIKEVLGRI